MLSGTVLCAMIGNPVEISTNDTDGLDIIIDDILVHTLYHESVHALIDVLKLPITGKGKDAVDNLSTLMLIKVWKGLNKLLSMQASFSILNRYKRTK